MSAKDTPRKGTTVNKKYQKNAPKTSTRPGLAVPDAVTIAMGEIAEDMREACSPWLSAPACRYWAH